MRMPRVVILSIALFLSTVFAVGPPLVSYAIDAASLYAVKKEAVVVIINERNITSEDLEKERKQPKKQPLYFAPPLYTYAVQDASGVAATYSSGTGFIIREDGLVMTNYHVVQNSKSLTIETASGQYFQADVVGFDANPSIDVALLKIRVKKTFPVLKIRSNPDLYVGGRLVMIGHPFLYKFTLSEAMVSKLSSSGVQVQSSILPGNSGSPLIDERGEVAGMIYAAIIGSETQGMAIPADILQNAVNNILGNKQSR